MMSNYYNYYTGSKNTNLPKKSRIQTKTNYEVYVAIVAGPG